MASKTNAELRAENRLLRGANSANAIASVLITAIKWVGLIAIARYGYLSIAALAGKKTLADIGVSFLSDVRISEAFAWTAGVGGMGYGLQQRRLRHRTIERMGGRISDLERQHDPKRSSSSLTRRGATNPLDAQ